MRTMMFWLRWSARDLGRRWMVVCALALVIAIGTGVAAAFGSMSEWRRLSNDASYAMLGMHDLAVTFPDTRVDADAAVAAVRQIPHASDLRAVEVRLDLPTQVDIGPAGQSTVVQGRIVGIDMTTALGPTVDRVQTVKGRALTRGDAEGDQTIALVERSFAAKYDLPRTGTVSTLGGTPVTYVGWARTPTYLLNGQGAWFGEPIQAVLFMPMRTASRLTGTAGQINQVLVDLIPGADTATVQREIEAALRSGLPDAPATVADRMDDGSYQMLYDDIDGDQQLWDFVSILVLCGAALATFNLASRIVAAQRREIGVGAALGLRAPMLAIRPVLFGVEVAVLGVVAGIGIGALTGWWITGILDSIIPLPIWRTPIQIGMFARAAALGTVIPLLGIAYPVIRAVRVEPADAIRTAHIAANGGRLGRAFGRIRLPGSSIWHLPVRQVLRAPGRAAMTAAGVGAAIAVLVAMLGLLDSMAGALDVGEHEQARGGSARTMIGLDTWYPVTDARVAGVAALPQVALAQPTLRFAGKAIGHDASVDLIVDVMDFRTAMWTPTMRDAGQRRLPDRTVPSGIVLSEKAAADLGVDPGDRVTVEHPRRTGQAGFETVRTALVVTAVHPNPMRTFAYLDAGRADDLLGLAGFANQVQVMPAAGASENDLRQALLSNPAVATVVSVTAASRSMRDMISEFTDLLGLLAGFVLLLALLIAFNAASISVDERSREHATMLAFGLRVRRVLGNTMIESLIIGLMGTAVGLVAGAGATWWAVANLVRDTMPDFGIHPTVAAGTILTALGLGVAAVTIAPLLTIRRVRLMDIPSTLRVVE